MSKLSWKLYEDFPKVNIDKEGSTYRILKYISSFPNEEVRTSRMEKDLQIRFQLRTNLEKRDILMTFKGEDDKNWTKLTPKGGRMLEFIEKKNREIQSNQTWDVFDSQMDEPEDRNFTNEMNDVKLRRSNPPRYDKRKDWYQSLNEKGNDSDVSNRYDQTSLTSGASRKFNWIKVAVSFDQWLYGKPKNLQTFVEEYTRLLTEVDPKTYVDIVDGGVNSLRIYVETHGDPDYSIYESLLKKHSLRDKEETEDTNYKFKDPVTITEKKTLDTTEQKKYSKWKQVLSELDPPQGFIPTNEGMMTEEDIFDHLDYSSYKANRDYDRYTEPHGNIPNPDYDFEESRLRWRNFWMKHGGWSEDKLNRFEKRYNIETGGK